LDISVVHVNQIKEATCLYETVERISSSNNVGIAVLQFRHKTSYENDAARNCEWQRK
jgi:hypothetical protein